MSLCPPVTADKELKVLPHCHLEPGDEDNAVCQLCSHGDGSDGNSRLVTHVRIAKSFFE